MKKEINFFESIIEVCKHIPPGRVTSYGAIARFLGSAQSSRMVGWVLNKSISDKHFVPAHRVVNRNGLLTGKNHFGGSDIMKQLLESEGIKVVDDKVVDFEKVFWDPGTSADLGSARLAARSAARHNIK